VLSEGKVRLLHQQNELNEALSLNLNMQVIIIESPQFFTATILEWKKLSKPEKYKDIIISSLQFLVENNRVRVNATL
jgi:spore coat polysaccharide biosynthesis predicted glycosyltransferase SpsG